MKKVYVLIILGILFILSGCGQKAVTQANSTKSSSSTNRPIETRILNKVNDTKNAKTINFTNGWQTGTDYNTGIMTVEAGALKGDPSQGVMLVQNKNLSGKIVFEQQYPTPEKHGAVTIKNFNSHLILVL